MYNGKYAKHPVRRRRRGSKRISTLMASLLLLLTFAISGTLAFLVADTEDVKNQFTPGEVTTEVTEQFNGTVKSNVNVKNTGNINAYLRVKLISHRVNFDDQGEPYIIGGDAPIPPFTMGQGWAEKDGYYYYTSPVVSQGTPATPLIGEPGITLEDYTYTFYKEGDVIPEGKALYDIKSGLPGGGVQVIEVIAEGIQADGVDGEGKHPVTLAWGIEVKADGTLEIPAEG